MWGIDWYWLVWLVCFPYNHRPSFFWKICEFKGCSNLQLDFFPKVMMRLERRIFWFIDTPIIFVCMTRTVMLPSGNQGLLRSSLIIYIIHACGRLCSVLLSGITKPQMKQRMDFHSIISWSSHSFNQWRIYTTQHAVLLLLCKALNLIPTSFWKKNVSNARIVKQRKKGELWSFKLK